MTRFNTFQKVAYVVAVSATKQSSIFRTNAIKKELVSFKKYFKHVFYVSDNLQLFFEKGKKTSKTKDLFNISIFLLKLKNGLDF